MPGWRCEVPEGHVRNRPLIQMVVIAAIGTAIGIPIAADLGILPLALLGAAL